MVCILPCRNWRVKVLTSFVYIVESAILHLARFKFRMNRLVREIARLAVVANPVSIYVPGMNHHDIDHVDLIHKTQIQTTYS